MNDPRPTFRDAVAQAGRVVAATSDDDLDRPTPCDDFDVRTLLGHLDAVIRRITHALEHGSVDGTPSIVDGFADGDRTTTWKSDVAALERCVDDDATLDRTVTVPFGSMPGRAALAVYTSELTTHAWDLAAAIGRLDLLEDALAQRSLSAMESALPAEPRGGPIPFGPVVEVASDAGAYERLAGWLGRDPVWARAE